MLEQVDASGGGRDSLLQNRLAQQRVDKGTLARIELTDDDQQEQLIKLGD